MDDELTFGEWLEDLYSAAGMNQGEFAERIGVAQNTISSWVTTTKRPQRRRLPRIAEELGVSVDEVARRAGYRQPVRFYTDAAHVFREMDENRIAYDNLSDLRTVQEQLQLAMDMLNAALEQRGVIIKRVDPPE